MGEILVEIVGKFKTLHSRSRREVSTSPACQGGTEPGLADSLGPPWTVAHQVLLSMEFSRQEYWSELPFLSLQIFQLRD